MVRGDVSVLYCAVVDCFHPLWSESTGVGDSFGDSFCVLNRFLEFGRCESMIVA